MYFVDLLDLLCELVPQLSAYDRDRLFKLVLKPDMLIVLANHAAMEVRIAVIRVCTYVVVLQLVFITCVSYAEARNSYRLDVRPSVCLSVCPSVRHTLAPYQNG